MKMKPEHYSLIKAGFAEHAEMLRSERVRYIQANRSLSWFLWDTFRFLKIAGHTTNWVCDVLYPAGLTDKHIDTALAAAARSIGITE